MPRILMTGASGGIGTRLRKLLPPIYPDLLLSDLKAPADLAKDETFKAADLADPAGSAGHQYAWHLFPLISRPICGH